MKSKNVFRYVVAILILLFAACKKSSTATTDNKSLFVGSWTGAQQVTGAPFPYKFSLQINNDNTLVNIDSAFSNQAFPGTYTYTTDSLKISYANGTKWLLKFSNNYASASGNLLGFAGAVGTISMTKK